MTESRYKMCPIRQKIQKFFKMFNTHFLNKEHERPKNVLKYLFQITILILYEISHFYKDSLYESCLINC